MYQTIERQPASMKTIGANPYFLFSGLTLKGSQIASCCARKNLQLLLRLLSWHYDVLYMLKFSLYNFHRVSFEGDVRGFGGVDGGIRGKA